MKKIKRIIKNKTIKKRKLDKKDIISKILPYIILALNLFVLISYITGPALEYLNSDCVDSLLWSKVIVDSGKILAEDFYYAAILPFGSPLWMVPIIKIFGYTMLSQTISMVIFSIIFTFSAYFLFKSLKWNNLESSIGTFILCMFLSSSTKLREIMWEHVIYYSLGILLVMLLTGLVIRLLDYNSNNKKKPKKEIKKYILMGVLLLISIGCAVDGMQMIALTVAPVAGSLIAYIFFEEKTDIYSNKNSKIIMTIMILITGLSIGLITLIIITKFGKISASYANTFTSWTSIDTWKEHLALFLESYLTLFGIEPDPKIVMTSLISFPIILKLISSLIVLICPFLLLLNYKKLSERNDKLLSGIFLITFLVIMFGFICGRLSEANWRLTPLLGISVIATLEYIRNLIKEKNVNRRSGIVLVIILTITSLFISISIQVMPRNEWKNVPLQKVADMLISKGYNYGYATFWNAGELMLRSNDRIQIANIIIGNEKIVPQKYQTMKEWYLDIPGNNRYFVMLDYNEYQQISTSKEWLKLCDTKGVVEQFNIENYVITVFKKNIFTKDILDES